MPAAIVDFARSFAASMSQGMETIALTPCETIVSTCDACRCASLSALANTSFAFAAAMASLSAFCSATRNGSILSNETPITRSFAVAMPGIAVADSVTASPIAVSVFCIVSSRYCSKPQLGDDRRSAPPEIRRDRVSGNRDEQDQAANDVVRIRIGADQRH